jgi:hypothetical protein
MSGDEGIMDAFRSAVDETMREMEAEMKTRVRMGGKRNLPSTASRWRSLILMPLSRNGSARKLQRLCDDEKVKGLLSGRLLPAFA